MPRKQARLVLFWRRFDTGAEHDSESRATLHSYVERLSESFSPPQITTAQKEDPEELFFYALHRTSMPLGKLSLSK